jgi:hypothetical protein
MPGRLAQGSSQACPPALLSQCVRPQGKSRGMMQENGGIPPQLGDSLDIRRTVAGRVIWKNFDIIKS